jgi:G3E family GTPase
MNKQINLIINGKGGVGKSFFATNFVQYLKDCGIAHCAIDSDHENSTLKRFHPQSEFISLEHRREIDRVFTTAETSNLLVIDCRAASTDLFIDFFDEVNFAEVIRLTRLKKQHAESLYQMRYQIRRINDNAAIFEREIANIREDLRTRTSTRGDNFVMAVKNETFTDRVKAGRALVFAAAAIKPFESTKAIGSIGGFPISIEKFDERATLLIHGKHSYRANVSDSPAGTIASLEHALDSIEDRLRERETNLAQSRRQIVDLTNQLDQPFEHEEKLAVATKRQQEVVAALDITKNQASAAVDEGTEQVATVMEQTPSQSEYHQNRAVALTP